MTFFNPGYGLILPFLFIFTIPLAILAALTTTLAFCILLFRVTLVYVELALTVLPQYLLGSSPPSRTRPHANSITGRRRKRRTSSTVTISGGSITPVAGGSGLGLNQHIHPIRDYEGVGGWRLGPPSDDDDLWTKINSRLELPADHGRRHKRSLTAGSMSGDGRQRRTFSFETVMNSAKARTPPSVVLGSDGFFPLMPPSPGALRRTSSGLTGASISSGSSKASSVLNLKQRW